MRWVSLLGGVSIYLLTQLSARGEDMLSPAELRLGPSLRETGRMAPALLPGTEITPPRADVPDERERSIPAVKAPAAGTIDPAILAKEVGAHLAELGDCVIEAARREQIPPGGILADTLTLRFRIEPAGHVTGVEVVATSPTDPSVLACVKSDMKDWTFTRPKGGPVPIERAFSFLPAP